MADLSAVGVVGTVAVAAPPGSIAPSPAASPGRVNVAAPPGTAGATLVVAPPAGQVPVPPEWAFYVDTPLPPARIGALTTATARKLTWQLDGPATATFTMPSGHPETTSIVELATDISIDRNGAPLFRGRTNGSTDTLSATTETSNFTVIDYRGMLEHRILWSTSTLNFTQRDQADIAWQLLADTQALPGGNWGMTRGFASPTGRIRDRTYVPGTPLSTVIGDLGRVIDGFDWEIDPWLRFNLFYPQRGRSAPVTLVYGAGVAAVTTTTSPTSFGNAIRFTGSSVTVPAELNVGSFPSGIGRWDITASDPNVLAQGTIDEAAAGALAADSKLVPALSVTLAPGTWDPAQLWLGDAVRLIVNAGRLNIDVTRRIVQIDVTVGDDGEETVVLAIGAAPPRLSDLFSTGQVAALSIGPYGTGPAGITGDGAGGIAFPDGGTGGGTGGGGGGIPGPPGPPGADAPIAAFYPLDVPPASGTNLLGDASFQYWASVGGSPWRRIEELAHARVEMDSPFTITPTSAAVAWDTVVYDFLNEMDGGSGALPVVSFYIPIRGLYQVHFEAWFSENPGNLVQLGLAHFTSTGTVAMAAVNVERHDTLSGSLQMKGALTATAYCQFSDSLHATWVTGGATITGVPGHDRTFMTIDLLSTKEDL